MNEEKKVDLEGIMYNEDQTFKPLTSTHGNVNGDLASLRNVYMEAERDYFEQLLVIDRIRERFLDYVELDSESLFRAAIDIQNKIEEGTLESKEDIERMKSMSPGVRDEYHMSLLEQAEGLMCLLFAATRDKVELLDLVKTNSGGRSR